MLVSSVAAVGAAAIIMMAGEMGVEPPTVVARVRAMMVPTADE